MRDLAAARCHLVLQPSWGRVSVCLKRAACSNSEQADEVLALVYGEINDQLRIRCDLQMGRESKPIEQVAEPPARAVVD